jgi:hypothetical protein
MMERIKAAATTQIAIIRIKKIVTQRTTSSSIQNDKK